MLQNECFQEQIQEQQALLHEQENTIQSLNHSMKQLGKENEWLLQEARKNASKEKSHKQTHTALPGEDCVADGSILYPSASVVNAIREKQE